MKRLFSLLTIVLLFGTFISACGEKSPSVHIIPESDASPSIPATTPVSNPLSNLPADLAFQVEKEPFPTEVEQAMAGLKEVGGTTTVTLGERTYLIIALGQRNTGGYTVEISDIEKEDGGWVVHFIERKPGAGVFVPQMITYPTLVASIPKISGTITFKGTVTEYTAGDKSHPAKTEAENIIVEVPKANQLVVGDTIKVEGKARVFEGALIIEVYDNQGVIAKAPVQTEAGAPAFADYSVELKLTNSPRSKNGYIRAYSDSPKDGSVVNEVKIPVQFQ